MLRRTFLKSALASFAAVGLIGKINIEATKFLRYRTVRYDELRTLPSGYRGRVSEDHLKELAASVDKLGWCNTLTVLQQDDGSYLVLDGKIRTDCLPYIKERTLLNKIPVIVWTKEEHSRHVADVRAMYLKALSRPMLIG